LLGKRKDIQRVDEDEQNIDGDGYAYRNADVAFHTRGDIIYNERDVGRINERVEETQRKFSDVLFSMFQTHRNFVTLEDEDMRTKMINLVFE
jgi:hypothetical protein